jgi:threonine dehydrogenase-like Zn-dependent dehydrogenase
MSNEGGAFIVRGYGMLAVNKPGWIEKEKPTAGPLDAILKPIALAPCSSDTHALHGGAGEKENLILGHEAIGEVVEVGSLVKRFKPGDKVVVPCCTPDWEQVALQEKGINNAHDAGLMASFKFLSSKDGVFAEYFHCNNADANLVHLPDDVSVEDALMTVDMMSTGFHTVENADVTYGDSVVVFGIGPIGLMSIAGSALRGAGKIYGVGTRPECASLAREYGATDIISYKDGDTVEQILEKNGGQVDRAIIANTNTSCMVQALQLVRPNGTISSIAFYDFSDTIAFPTALWGLGMSNVTLRCGFCPGGAYRIEKLLEVIRADRCHPGKMLNYKYHGFEKIEEAFTVMDQKPRDLIKPIVYCD